MGIKADGILALLDRRCEEFTFPMLDNGYTYLAATRLTLFRSPDEWAMVIEVFGFSPRAGLPDTCFYTFGNGAAADHDSATVRPVEEGAWQDEDDGEVVAKKARHIVVRGTKLPVPAPRAYADHGIELEDPPAVQVFELCRYLAAVARDQVLARPEELRSQVRPGMVQLLQLDEWHHPNVVDSAERPSGSAAFQQLARVLETGNVDAYRPALPPNTHWRHWPDGGTL